MTETGYCYVDYEGNMHKVATLSDYEKWLIQAAESAAQHKILYGIELKLWEQGKRNITKKEIEYKLNVALGQLQAYNKALECLRQTR